MSNQNALDSQVFPALNWDYIHDNEKQIAKLSEEHRDIDSDIKEQWEYLFHVYDDRPPPSGTPAMKAHLEFIAEQEKQVHRSQEKRADIHFRKCQLEGALILHFEAYAAPRCRALCDKIQTKLPRELRDMIYKELFQAPRYEVMKRLSDSDSVEHVQSDQPMEKLLAWIGVPDHHLLGHWFKEKFVGPETLPEVIETWYRVSTFRIENCKSLVDFLNDDLWGCGVMAYDHVRHVSVSLDTESSDAGVCIRIPEILSRGHIRTEWNMSSLLDLKTSTRIMFAISTLISYNLPGGTEEDNIRTFVHAASKIFPELERIRSHGYDITIAVLDYKMAARCRFKIRDVEMSEDAWAGQIVGSKEVTDLDVNISQELAETARGHLVSRERQRQVSDGTNDSAGCVARIRNKWRAMRRRFQK